jgi:hypothetical protein
MSARQLFVDVSRSALQCTELTAARRWMQQPRLVVVCSDTAQITKISKTTKRIYVVFSQSMYTHTCTHTYTHPHTRTHTLSTPLSRVSSASRLLIFFALTISGLFDYVYMCMDVCICNCVTAGHASWKDWKQ